MKEEPKLGVCRTFVEVEKETRANIKLELENMDEVQLMKVLKHLTEGESVEALAAAIMRYPTDVILDCFGWFGSEIGLDG